MRVLAYIGVFLFISGICTAIGDVHLPSIFSDHMVLAKAKSVPVWGSAAPGESVSVTLNGQVVSSKAGADGKWRLTLDLRDSPPGPFEMRVVGKNEITISDVVVGLPWFLMGQSNPQRTLKESADAPAEIAQSDNPLLREFRIKLKGNDTPQSDVKGSWVVASPETSAEFSAIGYYFGKKLQTELKQPVGIINVTWGGTFIEAWLSKEAIDKDPALRAGEDARLKEMSDFATTHTAYLKNFGDWLKTNGREDKACPASASFAAPNVAMTDWTPVTLPGKLQAASLPSNGVIWVRKEIEVPAEVKGLVIKASLGMMTAFPEAYWNGRKIYEMPYQKIPGDAYSHYFAIPQAEVRPGKATFALRLYAPVLTAEILTVPTRFMIGPIALAGPWMAKAEYALPALSPEEIAAAPKEGRQPPGLKASAVFNGVVNPIISYGIDGVLWYQGESNTGIAYQYRTTFPLLIDDLRTKWNEPTLPVYFCQLANFLPKSTKPGESGWAELRESQSLALKLPNTAQAVLIDLGESDDTHPRNKKDVGERLARIALAKQYKEPGLIWSGPEYDSMTIEGSQIRVKFAHADGGLVAKPLPKTYDVRTLLGQTAPLVPNSPGSELEGFAICGEDHHWAWADAKIDGACVLVRSKMVPSPIAVRYGWADNPTCNLYNGGGLPASPFRTDAFLLTTQKYHYWAGPGRY